MRYLQYKLRMVCIPISGPSCIYEDNTSALHNTSRPESVFRKKRNLVCYHAVCESIVMGKTLVGHIICSENGADLMTNSYVGKEGSTWSEKFSMIFMMNISHK